MLNRMRELLRRRTRAEAQSLGHQAGEWLADETLNVALAGMRDSAVKTWLGSTDARTREDCWHELRRIDAFVKTLRKLMEHGMVAQERDKRSPEGA